MTQPNQEGFTDAPPPSTPFKPSDYQGALCIAIVHKLSHGVRTQYGVKSTIDASMIILNPDGSARELVGVNLWNVKLVGQLSALIGRYTLGRIALSQPDKPGQSPPVVLAPATNEDRQLAQRWMAANPGRIEQIQEIGARMAEAPKSEYTGPDNSGNQNQYGYAQQQGQQYPPPGQQVQQGYQQPPQNGYAQPQYPQQPPPQQQYYQPQPAQQPAYASAGQYQPPQQNWAPAPAQPPQGFQPAPTPESHPIYDATPAPGAGALPPPPPVTNPEQPPF